MKIRKSHFLFLIPIVIVLVAVIFWTTGINEDENYIVGIVEIDEIDVASKIPGRIEELLVKEGDKIKKGTVLARLESKEIDAKVDQAVGAMEAAKSKLSLVKRGARKEEKFAAEKMRMQAKHQLDYAGKTRERFVNLLQDSVISQQEFDEIDFKYNVAIEQLAVADAKLSMVMQGAREEEKLAVAGLVRQAEGAYNEAMAYNSELEVVSPVDGEISNKIADAGEIIASGYPLFTIINPEEYYVVLQIREDELNKINIGDYFEGNISALDNEQYKFRVSYISAMGSFATWKPTNRKGEIDLKTFEVHLRSGVPIKTLRPGMTVKINF